MTVTLSPRRWTGVFSPRKKFRTPRTPLDTVDSLDNQKFNQIFNVATPRPGRKVCDHCGVEAASARLHCVRGTSRMEDESNDYHISLCDRCMKKEDKGELKSQLRTARHNIMDKRVRKVEKMKLKMRKFWKDMLGFFAASEEGEGSLGDLKDLQELDKNLSASFHSWIMKHSKKKRNSGGDSGIESDGNESEVKDEAEGSPQQASWRQWAFYRRRNDGTKKKTKKVSTELTRRTSSSDNSDSLFFSVWPNCFGASSVEM